MRRAGLGAATLSLIAALASATSTPSPTIGGLGLLDTQVPITAPSVEVKYLIDGKEPPVGLSAKFKVGGMPPVMNQGGTPRCVSFSISTVKNWQDRREFGHFFDFNEIRFANLIGTTSAGAFMSVGLARARDYGYPVVDSGNASRHQIASYWSIPVTTYELKRAISTYGPILVISPWYQSWNYPRANGQLPAPNYIIGGHAFVLYGWDDRGFRLRNSWGTGWGLSGDAFLRYSQISVLYGAFVTVDEVWHRAPAPTPTAKPTAAPPTPTPSAASLTPPPVTTAPTLYPTATPTETPYEPDWTVAPDDTPDPPVPPSPFPWALVLALVFGGVAVVLFWRKPE